MAGCKPPEQSARDQRRAFKDKVEARQRRKEAAKAKKLRTVWFGLGTFGLVGWSVAIPTVVGAALGVWLDRTVATPQISWTLTMLVAGVALGCWNAWQWVDRESTRDQDREAGDEDDV